MSSSVRYSCRDGIGRLVLDRPPVNVLDCAALEELATVLSDVANDGAARVLALSGAGRAFCAGAEVADHLPERVGRMLPAFDAAVRALAALEIPTVALVHGAALGGGMELALACDVVLCSDAATFGQPEVRLGVFPPVAAAVLPGLVGRQRALDMILTGRTLDAAEAVACGVATRAFPAERFGEESERYVSELAQRSAPALRLAKRAVAAVAPPIGAVLAGVESLYLNELMRHADPLEGLTAFIEKRKPVWSHR